MNTTLRKHSTVLLLCLALAGVGASYAPVSAPLPSTAPAAAPSLLYTPKTPAQLTATPNPFGRGTLWIVEIAIITGDGVGDFIVAPAVANKTHVLVSLQAGPDADTSIGVKQGTTVLSGARKTLVGLPYEIHTSVIGTGESPPGADLKLTVSGTAANIGGHLIYLEL